MLASCTANLLMYVHTSRRLTNQTIHMGRHSWVMPKVCHGSMLCHLGVRECLSVLVFGSTAWQVCHQSGAGECKSVLDTLARSISCCCAVLGMLHHGMILWVTRCQKGYLLAPWYLYGTTTAALHKPSGLVPMPWVHLDLAV